MEVKYELTPTDIIVYQKETTRKGALYYGQVLIIQGVLVAFIISDVVLSMFLTISPTTSLGINLLTRSLIGVAILYVSYFVLTSIGKWKAKKLSVAAGPNGVFCEHTLAIDENGYTETTHVNKNSGIWAGVESLEVTESFVTIKVRLCCNYFIPRRAFANDDDIRAFVTTVRNYISPIPADTPRTIGET